MISGIIKDGSGRLFNCKEKAADGAGDFFRKVLS